jgi:hypothetical protein
MTTMTIAPSQQQVVLALGRQLYESFCEVKGWTPHPKPYVDAGALRSATIAVKFLGYEDDVLEDDDL